jgi:hypothetical protein
MSRRHPLRRFAASPSLAFGGRGTAPGAGGAGPSVPLDQATSLRSTIFAAH